jgi:hypothetical protein
VSGRNGRGLKWLGCGAFYRPEEVGRREAVGVEWASFKTLVSVAGAREVVRQGAITGEEEAQGGGHSASRVEEGGTARLRVVGGDGGMLLAGGRR